MLPGGAVRDVALIGGSAVLVGLSAQIAVPLPFTPVPLSGQTFAVLLAAAAIGPSRGVLAAVVVGGLARRGADRTATRTVGLMISGNLAIYVVGVSWLIAWTGIGIGQALRLGVLPFLIGDLIKIVLAAGLLPATWSLVHRHERNES